jgi:hypothetical protein
MSVAHAFLSVQHNVGTSAAAPATVQSCHDVSLEWIKSNERQICDARLRCAHAVKLRVTSFNHR